MITSSKSGHDLFRILLFRNDATEICLETAWDALRLPVLSVSAHARVAEAVTSEIRNSWNLDTYCLFPLSSAAPLEYPIRDLVVEACLAEADPPRRMQWFGIDSLSPAALQAPSDFAAVQRATTTLDQYRRNEIPGAFGRPNWLSTVTEWVEIQARSADLRLTGKFRQFNASPAFSLLRYETDGAALWFKAVGEPNRHEFGITLELASAFPAFVPHILATRPDWNAWLAVESEGCHPNANPSDVAWASAANNLARLQTSSVERGSSLIGAGCKDLSSSSLMRSIDPFLDAMGTLMEQPGERRRPRFSRQTLRSLGLEIASALRRLTETEIPNTLGHLDMNPGNLLAHGTHCVFLDWAEAYFGPPFFSFQYLLESFRRLYGVDSQYEQSLVSAYAKIWACFAPSKKISAAFRTVPLLAAFAYGASNSNWRKPENISPEAARFLRSLTRRMKREADALQDRRLACVR